MHDHPNSTYLPEIFVINLESSLDRRERIIQSMPPMLSWHIFPAISGKNVQNSLRIGAYQLERSKNLTPNEFACKASHLSLLNHVVTTSLHSAVIMEDDAAIPTGFDVSLKNLIKQVPEDFDIVYLSCNTDMHVNIEWKGLGAVNLNFPRLDKLPTAPENPALFRLNRAWGLPAYLVSQTGAKKILDYSSESISYDFDYPTGLGPVTKCTFPTEAIDLMLMSILHRLNAYIALPLLAHPNLGNSDSDIGYERGYLQSTSLLATCRVDET